MSSGSTKQKKMGTRESASPTTNNQLALTDITNCQKIETFPEGI
jgi:hypothetical protein